jgi:hypothetical protein
MGLRLVGLEHAGPARLLRRALSTLVEARVALQERE